MTHAWEKAVPSNGRFRVSGVLTLAAWAWYVSWLVPAVVAGGSRALAVPFVLATALMLVGSLLHVVTGWTRSAPPPCPLGLGREPRVAVLVPTCGEPLPMLRRTLESVLEQDYPSHRLVVVVSDELRREDVAHEVARLAGRHPGATIHLNHPPSKADPRRRGRAKAGNLNSAMELLDRLHPDVEWVEPRDADDVVPDPSFLRHCVGQLVTDARVAFVQTVKEAEVGRGDPFDNLSRGFYRGGMFARNAANAVFPCGSGLVWRRQALTSIGGFPHWNLVEDYQSGIEALRRGWQGRYLPIVGARGQIAPEDLANVHKQRGTWAVDAIRMLLWGDKRGLGLRQRLQFLDIAMYYAQAFAWAALALVCAAGAFLGTAPVAESAGSWLPHLLPLVVCSELTLLLSATAYSPSAALRHRIVTLGLTPVFLRAWWIALRGGPTQVPHYVVTRKEHVPAWYWRESLPQALLVVVLVAGVAAQLGIRMDDSLPAAGHSVVMASLLAVLLARYVTLSWHGAPAPYRGWDRRSPVASATAPRWAAQVLVPRQPTAAQVQPLGFGVAAVLAAQADRRSTARRVRVQAAAAPASATCLRVVLPS